MTEPEADLKGCDLKKQSQFVRGANYRNASVNNGLRRYERVDTAKKQSQFKANFTVRLVYGHEKNSNISDYHWNFA